MADPTFTPREPDEPTFRPREKQAVEAPTFTPRDDPYDPLAASAGIAPAGTPTIDKLLTGPSWADKALEQSKRDQAAFAKGGVREMLKDTEGTQELAGGFSDAGIAGVTKGVGGGAAKAAALKKVQDAVADALLPPPIKANPESLKVRQDMPGAGELSPQFIRSMEDSLYKVTQSSEADKIEFLKKAEALPEAVKNPVIAEKFHHAVEGGKLTPQERELFNQTAIPLQRERAELYKEITGSGVPTEELMKGARRVVKGKHPQFDELGGMAPDPILGGRTLPRSTASLKERNYYAIEAADKSRIVIQKMKHGGARLWRDGKVIGEVPDRDIEVGEILPVLDKPWTIKQATTKEIEQHTPTEYRKNFFENTIDDIIRLRKVKRSLEVTGSFKAHPAWLNHASMGNRPHPPEWIGTTHPQFRGWVMDPKIAHVLDDFHNLRTPLDETLGKVNAFIVRTLFWGPIPHIENVLGHWYVGRGFDWIRPQGLKSLVIDGAKALHDVYSQGPITQALLREGSALQYPRTANQSFYEQLAKKMGSEIERDPRWKDIAQTLGFSEVKKFVEWWYDKSSRVMWMANDMMMVQRVLELKRQGMTTARAIEDAEKHIPNYRVPSEVMRTRQLAQMLKSPNVLIFAPYHYGVFKSYAHMVNDLRKGTPEQRREAIGNIFALATLQIGWYPLFTHWFQQATGDKHKEKLHRGPAAIPQAVIDMASGNKELQQVISNVMTPAPSMKLFSDMTMDVFNKNRIYEPADLRHHRYGRVAAQLLNYAAQSAIEPYQLLNQYIKDEKAKGIVRTLMDQQLGLKEPTPRQLAGKAKAKRIQEREANKRRLHPQGLIESMEKEGEHLFKGPMQ